MATAIDNIKEHEKHGSKTADDRFNWRYQDKTYNELFKKWRKQTKDSVGFYYADNPNELTYQDGVGFVKDYPEAAEANSLRRVYNVLGISLMLFTLMDIIYMYVFPMVLGKLGLDIYCDFFGRKLYGNDWLILSLSLITEVAKRIFPFVFCYKFLHMPAKVMLPTKIINKELFRAAVPAMCLVAGVCAAVSGVYNWILGGVHIEPVITAHLPDSRYAVAAYIILNVLIVPAISEFCARGVILQLLRQFGDGSAIIITALIISCLSYNISQFCYIFITAVVIGYFTVRTGSVITAVLMRIVNRVIVYGIYAAGNFTDEAYSGVLVMATIFILVMFGLVYMIWFMLRRSDKLGMSFRSRYLRFVQKCTVAFTSVPMVIWSCSVVIMTVLNLKLNF